MAIVRTLGKNTLGDNNKMKIAMRDYDMSTHDISTVFRSSIGVGMLVPFCKILCQKGDIIDLDLINKTLSQPTLGPLFGSFKLQHFMFFGGFRLYNSWLHNNRTGIGMKMSDIKLPMMVANTQGTASEASTNISASALYKYLGWSKSKRSGAGATNGVLKNGVPLLLYIDIFKNFFANTQEKNFYMLKGIDNKIEISGKKYNIPFSNQFIEISDATTLQLNVASNNYPEMWGNVSFIISDQYYNAVEIGVTQLSSDLKSNKITLNKVSSMGYRGIIGISFKKGIANYITVQLKQYDLKILDQVRDVILHKKGNQVLTLAGSELGESNNGSKDLTNFFNDLIVSQSNKLGGMLLKTYDSDIFNNWVQTDWIDGTGGITDITSIDITANDGKLTMDALNLQQKVYNMLNRIAVSGGT
nr:MAG TPA: Major capsid protein [Bacteriophage sp.]